MKFIFQVQSFKVSLVSLALNLPYSRGIAADIFLRAVPFSFDWESIFLDKGKGIATIVFVQISSEKEN